MRKLGVKKYSKNKSSVIAIALLIASVCCNSTFAQSLENYEMIPPLSEFQRVSPKVMLAISGDHQMFMKAYNDWDDLDGDNIPDVSYNPNFRYSGYFDSARCYNYTGSATDIRNRTDQTHLFEPVSGLASYSDGSTNYPVRQFCLDAHWSGNFLNWATMTRMDIVRYVLYGGKRTVDTDTQTVLERAYLPNDAHSFAKYYDGPHIRQLTSFGDGYFSKASSTCAADAFECLKKIGITFCNTTTGQTTLNYSSNDSQIQSLKPKMRVAFGNYSLWASSERLQCTLGVENYGDVDSIGEYKNYPGGDFTSNENDFALTGLAAYGEAPKLIDSTNSSTWKGDFNVVVEVCDQTSSGDDPTGPDHICKSYPNGAIKPIGILQINGEKESNPTEFGLVTRSFESNKTGGLLRSNIVNVSEEVDPATGQFLDATNPNPDPDAPASVGNSLIGFLNDLRIVDYKAYAMVDGGWDDVGHYFRTNCPVKESSFDEGQCKNWGNPFGEVMGEAYKYLANANTLSSGVLADTSYFGNSPSKIDPLFFPAFEDSPDFSCVNFNVVGFNASAVSYDNDLLAETFGSLGLASDDEENNASSETVGAWTNVVAGFEDFITGSKQFFIGDAASDGEAFTQCSPKTLGEDGGNPNLAGATGTCPDAPGLEGGFSVAGLAYFARTNDLRPDKTEKEFTVETFGITLAGNIPSINVPVGTQTVKIVPACRVLADESKTRAQANDDIGNCALVDFKPIIDTPGVTPTRYLIVWEDSEQGSDYDQDMMGIIEYEMAGNKLKVRTNVFSESTQSLMLFGYVISGVGAADESDTTNEDGIYYDSWIQTKGIEVLEEDIANDSNIHDIEDALAADENNDRDDHDPFEGKSALIEWAGEDTYSALNRYVGDNWREFPLPDEDTVSAEFLESPLYYAAKYGSFEDEDGDGVYTAGVDTIPLDDNGDLANYALVRQPSKLRAAVAKILNNVTDGAKTRTAAAVASGSVTGEGLALQSLYAPKFRSAGGDTVEWVGFLNGLFVDDKGNYREDHDQDGILDGDSVDYVVEFNQDEDGQTVVFSRYTYGADGKINRDSPVSEDLDLVQLKPLWSANKALESYESADLAENRTTFLSGVNTKRHILVGRESPDLDAATPYDGVLKSTEVADFEASLAANADFVAMLGLAADETDRAENIINYIRGIEVEGFRSRTYKPSAGSDATEVWRLGDIVHSTPKIVGRPDEGYDREYGDKTYEAFIRANKDRRHMVYVGANDGMLHAFNAGFFDPVTNTYSTARAGDTPGANDPDLGAEMWAYIPSNALPHLKWLADPAYSHVYYVDTEVKTFDTNIFDYSVELCENVVNYDYVNNLSPDSLKSWFASEEHMCGWGTIMVVGMRFGGKDYPVDMDGDGTNDHTFRSSYIVLDITDPESEPRLLAEFSDEDMGFAVGSVELVKQRIQNESSGTYIEPSRNRWYLMLGSGPNGADAYETAYSEKTPYLFSLSLNDLVDNDIVFQKVPAYGNDVSRIGYIGGITSADWNRDFVDDMLYFGLVGDVLTVPDPLDLTSPVPFRGALLQADLDKGINSNLFPALGEQAVTDLLKFEDGSTGSTSVTNLPFSTKPLVIEDRQNNGFVYAGTGKFLVKGDLEAELQNYFFGLRVKDGSELLGINEKSWLTDDDIEFSKLFNSSTATMKVDSSFTPIVEFESGTYPLYGFGGFIHKMFAGEDEFVGIEGLERDGWYIEFNDVKAETTFNNSVFTYNTVIFNTYLPEVESCAQAGDSLLYFRDMHTGLVSPHLKGSLNGITFSEEEVDELKEVNEFPVDEDGNPPRTPKGPPAPPSIDNMGRLFAPGCTEDCGDPVDGKFGTVSWREISLEELE